MTRWHVNVETKIVAVDVIETGFSTSRQAVHAEFGYQIIVLDIAVHVPMEWMTIAVAINEDFN